MILTKSTRRCYINLFINSCLKQQKNIKEVHIKDKISTSQFNTLLQEMKENVSSFEALYEYYCPKIIIYIYRKFKNKELAYDVSKDFFAKMLKINISNYIESPTVWMFKICSSLAVDALQKENKYKAADKQELQIDQADDDSLYERFTFNDFFDKLKTLYAGRIILMHLWEGYSLREISEELNMNYNTVRQTYSRGLNTIG